MSVPDAPTVYVRLGLAIDRLLPDYVEAYYGPPELRAAVEAEGTPSPGNLEALADSLDEALAPDTTMEPERREFLATELSAMRTTIRILGGDAPDFVDEVHSLCGVRPEWVDESVFVEAHETLDQLLPGAKPLAQRVAAFRERSRVPVEAAAAVVRQLADDLRERARQRFDLPAWEAFEVAFVPDQPWYAFNRYLGNAKSLIEINQDFALEVWDFPTLVAHEAYPGHHTDFSIKEQHLYREKGRLEHSIRLSSTPSALVAEGIAKNALQAVATQDDIASIFLRCYEAAGLLRDDAARAPDFVAAQSTLGKVFDNQALLFCRDGVSEDEVIAYGLRHALDDEAWVRHRVQNLKDPLSRSYGYNYTLGRDLVAAFLDASPDGTQAFGRLLSEPLTPGQLERTIKAPYN
jgi:hypothetical protein